MDEDPLRHLKLVTDVEQTIDGIVRNGFHYETPITVKAKLLLALVAQIAVNSKAIRVLIGEGLPTQVLAICRTQVEIMALISGIVHDDKILKLFEKKSLEGLRNKLRDLNMLDHVAGLDETIGAIHPDGTTALHIDRLLGDFESRNTGQESKLFYVGYRTLCDYTHPNYLVLYDAVLSSDSNSAEIRTHKLEHFTEGLGLGLVSSIAGLLVTGSEHTGLSINPVSAKHLDELFNRSLDLIAPIG